MKILIVHNSLNDGTSMSGVLKHYLLMARAWCRSGHQVDFLVAKAGFPQIQAQAPECGLVCSDTLFDASGYIDKTWKYFPAFGFRMLSAHWVKLPCQYDVVYASNFLIFELYPARTIARRCKARLVVKIQHVLHSQPQRRSLFDRLFLATERWSMRLAHRHADLIMCLSAPVLEDFHDLSDKMGLSKNNVEVVGCGLDFSELEKTPEQEPCYDVVFLGRMHEQKGVFDLPDVWESILKRKPDARLVVIGEGPHRSPMMEIIQERGMDASVHFTGGIAEDEKNRILKQSSIGLSLSYEEGWGLSVTEFLAAGLPVVAYDLPVFRALFDGILHCVPLGSKAEAAEMVLQLLGNPKQMGLSSHAGKEYVKPFNYQSVAQQESECMERILNEE